MIPNCFLQRSDSLRVLLLVLLGAPVFFAGLAASACGEEKRPPNIVLILADDLGFGELGCYGQKWIKTPHIDKLAAEGIRFTRHYSGNAVCAPSRCNLMTGKHPGHAEIRDNQSQPLETPLGQEMGWEFPGQAPITDEAVTIAEVLKQKNYATAAIGKWGLGHFGTTGDPNQQGFDLFYGYNSQSHAHNHYPRFLWRNRTKETLPGNDHTFTGDTYAQDRFREEALKFIDEHRDQPFFLYLPFIITHVSIQVPEASLVEYAGKIPEEDYEHKSYLKHPTPRAGYAAMVSHMDRDIGKIMAHLKHLGLDENTIVLFSSDNGATGGRTGGSDSDFFESTGGLRGYKGSLYEGGIRVPLIVRWPGKISAGTVSDHRSAFWDMLPTLAELTGTQPPDDLDGISFVPTLLGQPEKQQPHECLYWEFPGYGGQQALQMGDWKLIRQNLGRPRQPSPYELYNLAADPGETTNVAADHPEIVEKMKQRCTAERFPSPIFRQPALDNADRR